MDRRTVLTKTAKGLMEVTGKTSLLPRDQRSVLSHVDGKATVGDLRHKIDKLSENKLLDVLGRLMRDGFVREFVTAPASVSPPSQVPIVEEGADLDFTDALQANAARAVTNSVGAEADAVAREVAAARQREAEAQARREAEEKAKREAAEKAKREAEEKARREAEAKAKREAEERARREAEAKAKREAEEKARREAEEKARREAEARAKREAEEKAKREAEEKARREAEAKAQREAEEKARREAEAEAKAKRDAEEKARREAEAKREAEARARREAEEKARREAEARAKREAEEKAKRDAEEKARREAEEKARREAEERARREAEAKAKREAEERALREAEEKAKRDAEERARREAEARAKREAEENARLEAEEHARREAEARQQREREDAERRESEARIRRELEEAIRKAEQQSRAEAEAVAERREAEAAAKRAAEHKAKQEAEERAKREAAEQAKREAEDQAHREAEERARLEAEEQALREAEAREQREAEERRREEAERRQREDEERARAAEAEARAAAEREAAAQREAETQRDVQAQAQREAETQREEEERARKDAERKARDEDRARAKAEAEAAARARKEERAREKASQEMRHSQPAAPSKAPDGPAVAPVARRRKPNLARTIGIGAGAAALVGLAVLQFLPLDAAFYERLASESFGAPVKIQSASFSLLPSPVVKLENVTIGGEQVRIANVRAAPELGSMFGDRRAFKSVAISGVNVSPAGLGAVLWQKPKANGLSVGSVVGHDVKVALPGIELPPLEMTMQMTPDGAVQKVALASADRKLSANLFPGPGKATLDLNAATLQVPFGSSLKLADFSARGEVKPGEVALEEFDAHLWEGVLKGRGTLKYGDGWSFAGDVDLKQAEAAQVVPAVLASGRLLGRGAFTMRADEPAKLFEVARLEGMFTVQKGQLAQIDLARQMQVGSSAATSTLFNELSGQGAIEPGRVSLRNLKLGAGLLSATGNVDIEGGKQISGKVAAEMRTPNGGSTRGAFTVSGSPSQVVLKR